MALRLNPQQLNFYKTQARVYIQLAQIDAAILPLASRTLSLAIPRAPTDPKLHYNLALVRLSEAEQSTGSAKTEFFNEGMDELHQAVGMNWESNRD